MIINNKETATRLKMGYSVFIIVFLLLLVLSLIFTFLPNYMFELIWSIICVSLFTVYMIMNYNYIYYNDETDKILFRYQALNPFITNPKSIEIPKNSFIKYEISTSFFKLKKSLTLYQKTGQGIAKYQAVCLNSLSKKEKEDLFNSLSRICK